MTETKAGHMIQCFYARGRQAGRPSWRAQSSSTSRTALAGDRPGIARCASSQGRFQKWLMQLVEAPTPIPPEAGWRRCCFIPGALQPHPAGSVGAEDQRVPQGARTGVGAPYSRSTVLQTAIDRLHSAGTNIPAPALRSTPAQRALRRPVGITRTLWPLKRPR